MTRDGYETYQTYLALQRHFSTSYDYFKYNGKVKASKDAYQKRNDLYAFEKLCKIIPKEKRIDFFLAHFIEDPKCWIKSMSRDKLDEYTSFWNRFHSKFKEDMEHIKMHGPANAMRVAYDIPDIHRMVLSGLISIESIIVLDMMFPFIDDHKLQVKVPVVFPQHITKCEKYRPFVKQKVQEEYNKYTETAKAVLL